MADADTSDFEQWITDRIDFTTGPPLTGDTGDFEQWLTDRLDFAEYVEAAAVGQPMMLRGTTVPHIGRQWHPRVA